jgi:hypothetical protein
MEVESDDFQPIPQKEPGTLATDQFDLLVASVKQVLATPKGNRQYPETFLIPAAESTGKKMCGKKCPGIKGDDESSGIPLISLQASSAPACHPLSRISKPI